MVTLGGDSQVKVSYLTKPDYDYSTTAYVDERNLVGENKHTGEPLQLKWSDEKDTYIQVDDWEWDYDMYSDTYSRKDDPSITNWTMNSEDFPLERIE